MTFYNYTDGQRQETIKLLLDIQLHMPWKKARCECEHMNEAIKEIYEILDMVKHQTNQPEEKATRRIFNPVTGSYYNIAERSSVYKNAGDIKGLWRNEHKE